MLHPYLDLIAAGPQTLNSCIDYIEHQARPMVESQRDSLGLLLLASPDDGVAVFESLWAQHVALDASEEVTAALRGEAGQERLLLSICGPDRLERLFAKLFDESEFLSPYGLRALSAYHRDHPYQLQVEGITAGIDYEPAESTTPMFGGNSNWRGPIWFPLNYLMVSVLERYHRFYGDGFTIEYPTGSGKQLHLGEIGADLADRLISIFANDQNGRRACFGGTEIMQTDPAWHDNLIFSEYFHGDNGAAIGAFHQTGWTGVVADLIRRRHGKVESIGDVVRRIGQQAGQ